MSHTPTPQGARWTPRSPSSHSPKGAAVMTPRGSALIKVGAEAMLQSTAASRAVEKQKLGVFRLPPQATAELCAEPAGRPTGLHEPRSSVQYAPTGRPLKTGEALSAQETPNWQRKLFAMQPEMQEQAVRRLAEGNFFCGPSPKFGGRERANAPMGSVVLTEHMHSPVEDETTHYFRLFVSRARRGGPRSIMRHIEGLRSAAACTQGHLDLNSFSDVGMAHGLCNTYRQCGSVFSHFAGPNALPDAVVDVEVIARAVLGTVDQMRTQAVRDVWRQLDPDGVGSVEASTLLESFDPRRLPVAFSQARTLEEIRLELVESLGLDTAAPHRAPSALIPGGGGTGFDGFALDEVAAGRRPPVVGSHGRPVRAPAGQPSTQRASWRPRGDAAKEVAAQPAAVNTETRVSAEAFEAYYTAVSLSTPDDVLFLRLLRSPWTGREVHLAAEAMRHDYRPRKPGGDAGSQFQVFATFDDGSQRVVVLRDDANLGSFAGAAGADNAQIWAWGKDVHGEIIRRLEKQGIKGITHISVKPS